jgi:hypothetical protein
MKNNMPGSAPDPAKLPASSCAAMAARTAAAKTKISAVAAVGFCPPMPLRMTKTSEVMASAPIRPSWERTEMIQLDDRELPIPIPTALVSRIAFRLFSFQ